MAQYIDLKTAIKTKLESITGIKHVYDYEKGNLEGYPSACITGFSFDSPYETSSENLRKYTFKVRLYQEIKADGVGADTGEDRLDNLIDTILAAFEHDFTLSGKANMVFIKGASGWVNRELTMRTVEFDIECHKLVSI